MKKLLVIATIVAVVALTQAALAAASHGPLVNRFITDTLGGNGHASLTHGYRLITDTLAPGGGGTPLAGVASGGQSFNWGDAGIGATGAIGMALVLIGGSLVVLRKRDRLAI